MIKKLDAERLAVEIRIRAERKAGQLMKVMDKSKGGRPENSVQHEPSLSEFFQAKQKSNISDSKAKRWQKLAEIPDKEFEESVKGKEIPTTGIIS